MSDNRFPGAPMGPPQRPAGPYGAPRGNYAPPGPAWYGPPPGAPAPRPGGGRGRWIAITVVIAVALVAGAGGGWWWLSGGGSGGTGNAGGNAAAEQWAAGAAELGEAPELWRVAQGDAPSSAKVGDHWVTDKHLVRRLVGRVVAYELRTGKVAWELLIGGGSDATCPSSREQTTRVALLLSTEDPGLPGMECGKLTVLDIGTGKEVFTTDLPPNGRTAVVSTDVPVVFGERVVIPGGDGTRVLDANSGQVLQPPQRGAPCVSKRVSVFGDQLLVNAVCAKTRDKPAANKLRALDANLQTVWEWDTPLYDKGEPAYVQGVVSVDPLVVDLRQGNGFKLLRVNPASGDVVKLDAGASRGAAKYLRPCDTMALGSCQQARVVDGKVILTTIPLQVNPGDKNASPGMQSTEFRTELVALDLNTGKEAWRTGMLDGRAVHVVPTGDGSIVAFQSANINGAKAMLYSVDVGTGKLAPLLPIGQKAHDDEALKLDALATGSFGAENWQALWRDRVFIMFKMIHRAKNKGEVETVAFALPG